MGVEKVKDKDVVSEWVDNGSLRLTRMYQLQIDGSLESTLLILIPAGKKSGTSYFYVILEMQFSVFPCGDFAIMDSEEIKEKYKIDVFASTNGVIKQRLLEGDFSYIALHVPKNPQRVITVSEDELGDILAKATGKGVDLDSLEKMFFCTITTQEEGTIIIRKAEK